jgi:transcriptional regulator with GAF, ATPase, and Fis domain
LAYLTVYTQEGKKISEVKLANVLTTIGRDARNEIQLKDETIAPFHCQILAKEGKFILMDLESETGTYLNTRKVTRACLEEGARIKIGEYELEFSLERKHSLSLKEKLREIRQEVNFLYQKIAPKKTPEVARAFSKLEKRWDKLEEEIALRERAYRDLQTAYRAGESLARVHNIDKLFSQILDLALEVMTAERGFIVLINSQGEMIVKAKRGKNEQEIGEVSESVIRKVIKTRKPLLIANALQEKGLKDKKSIITQGIKSVISTPLLDKEKKIIGVIYLDSRFSAGAFTPADSELLANFSNYAAIALETELLREREKEAIRKLTEKETKEKYETELNQVKEEKEKLAREIEFYQFEELIGSSPQMKEVFSSIEKFAPTDISILITGETGTGKELVARAIHRRSSRRTKPFIVINCSAIPETLLESELFGHTKGAFTGAVRDKKGKFELAEGGTVFLDEVGELPGHLQVKLLRVLQEKEIERVGSQEVIKVDVRVIAATNKDLRREIEKGNFRQDLFYRLNGLQLHLPPLRERGDDIELISRYFLDKFRREYQKEVKDFTPETRAWMKSYSWPGNIRELENKVRRAVVMAEGKEVKLEKTEEAIPEGVKTPELSLIEARANLEREYLIKALTHYPNNLTQGAKSIGLERKNFIYLLKKYRLLKGKSE